MNAQRTIREEWWRSTLLMALCLSLSLHFLTYGIYRAGQSFGWWDVSLPFLQKLLHSLNTAIADPDAIAKALERQQAAAQEEVPLMFLDVLPSQASDEAPENAKYYGALNSQAANIESEKETDTPQIDGKQERIAKTVDTPQNNLQTPQLPEPPADKQPEEKEQEVINPDELQPDPAESEKQLGKTQEQPPEIAEDKVEKPGSPNNLSLPQPPTPKPGDMALAEVRPQPVEGEGLPKAGEDGKTETPKPRPRTLREARRLQPQDNSIAGEQMKQEGGVRRKSLIPSMDTKGTPFGAYDAWFIAQVQARWYFLLENNSYAYNWAGYVKVKFRLYYDGRITDFEIVENTSDDIPAIVCQKAIMENVPYRQWPSDLRRIVDKDYRELRFTFYYN